MPLDFSGQNLRGRSFKGQNLEGANFSYADIRGANFTGANLQGTNFSHAQAGLQRRWTIFLVCVSWLLSGVSGFLLSMVSALIYILANNSQNHITTWITLIVLIALVIILTVILRRGLNITVTITGVSFFTIAVVVAFISSFAFITSIYAATFANRGVFFPFIVAFVIAVAVVLAGFLTVCGVITGSVAGVITVNVAGTGTIAFSTFIILVSACASSLALLLTIVLGVNSLIITSTTGTGDFDFRLGFGFGGVFLIGAFALALISNYIARQAIRGDEKYTLVRNIAIIFTVFGGTSFRSADLTDADFTQASLKNTDLRNTILTNTRWHQAKKLDSVRPGKTYLENTHIRQVLVTGQGQEKKFDREDLRGVNFQGANLVDASFISADLSQANLQDADLSRVKLVQTQLDGTDLTGATLTGAYIEDWNITTDTKFDGVRCEYVYMRLPTKENPDPFRKPDNNKEIFADGEFGDFIKPIFDTLDLYHNQGIDPRAIAISFKQLAESNPDADLQIVGMEVRGEDKFLLRAKTAATADKSQLSAEYFGTYNEIKGLPEREIKLLLADKDNQIRRLENMVMTALERPSFYAQNYNNQGDTMSPSSKKESNFNLQGAQFAGGLVNAETVTANQIGGNITNYTTEQQQNLTLAATEIKQLLQQLEKTNPTATTSEKMTVAAKVVDEIEKNPTLKFWVIEALLSNQREALKEAIKHPLANILMASIDDWQNERDSLEQAYTLQSQKVASIRNAWVIETDPSRKFQYEQQLQSEERILKKLNDRLNAIE